jgi:hypothetical protein
MNNNTQEQRLLEYKKQLDLRVDTERRLLQLREQTKQVVESQRALEALRVSQVLEYQEKMKEAIKQRDFTKIAEYSKTVAKIEKEVKTLKQLAKGSDKINALTSKNVEQTQKINAKIEKMAMREARANNIVSRKIAQMQNNFSAVGLKTMEIKSAFTQYRLQNQIYRNDKKFDKNINFEKDKISTQINQLQNYGGFSSKELNKVNVVNKAPIADFDIKKEGNKTLYTHKTNAITIEDSGSTLVARGASNEDKVKALIAVSQAKGWDLSKVEFHGSLDFKRECEKQVKAALEKEKAKEKEEPKKEEVKKKSAIEELREMKAREEANKKALEAQQKEKPKTNSIEAER